MSNELLQKVIDTTVVGSAGGGLLNLEQSDRFIDYMFDETVLGQQVRVERMRANEREYDRIGVGRRILRGAVEATDTGENAGVFFTKISLRTEKLRLDWELSTESLEDNIEGFDLDDHIARLMATQVGNDLEDLAINGDTTSTDKTLRVFNGYRKIALSGNGEGAANVVDVAGDPLGKDTFNAALRAMPRKFMQQRNRLKFFTGSNVIQDYIFSLTDTATTPEQVVQSIRSGGPARTEGPSGFVTGYAYGVPVQEVPLFDEARVGSYSGATGEHGELWLTDPRNFLWGVKRDIQVYRQFAQKKDSIEYTVYLRAGVQIENTAAMVVVRNIKVG